MLPVAPLMIEHRLIERMIAVMEAELVKIQETKTVDPLFIDHAVDFIRTYADNAHHGKEEDILFRELKKKELFAGDNAMMEELIQDHVKSRATTRALVEANQKYKAGDASVVPAIVSAMGFLVGFYPVHIEKEDKHFFVPVMKYFTGAEKEAMLDEGRVFDRKIIHKKYERSVIDEETTRGLEAGKMAPNWLDYM